ncbi:MAG TPA: hypothetical protein VNP04_31465 [Alphaproteobacteria bacterium]|nr:hypothetical protein [Alphaproteobacteria bacterium]
MSGYPCSPLHLLRQALDHRLQALHHTLQRYPSGFDVLTDGWGLVVQRLG